jgi:hypothetical protein
MSDWSRFRKEAPELAQYFEQRLEETRICLIGTLRASGWPRISPTEATVVDGELMLSMMWRSYKALDLLRDARITLMTPQCDKDAKQGDLKLYGRALPVSEAPLRNAHADALEAAIHWRPVEPYHLFRIDLEEAGYITFAKDRRLLRWSASGGKLERLPHPDSKSAASTGA